MDKVEAARILFEVLAVYQAKSCQELVELIDVTLHFEKVGMDGRQYQVEVSVFWDDRDRTTLRVIGAIDDGGWRAFFPLSRDFLKEV